MSDSFYIGYEPRKPARFRRPVRTFAAGVALVLVVLAATFASGQHFDDSRFDFGNFVEYAGTVQLEPVPHLVLDDGTRVGLVAPGKQGATHAVRALDGARIQLRGQRIEREGLWMLEIDPASIIASDGAPAARSQPAALPLALRGEIVGAKCFLGVMNPGFGRTHEACARHCILGGVPAMLRVHRGEDRYDGVYLAGISRDELVRLAGRVVRVEGELSRDANLPVLSASSMSEVTR